MNREEVIELAREAGWTDAMRFFDEVRLERFANLVAAHVQQAEPPQVIHAKNCWSWGPAHYECACAEIAKLSGWAK